MVDKPRDADPPDADPPDADAPDAEAPAPETQAIDCPKCGSLMQRVYIEAVNVDRCEVCGGLWLDLADRQRLLDSPEAITLLDRGPFEPARVMNKVTRIECPRDSAPMIHQVDAQQRHIGFERCSICGGVFLDAGELADLGELTFLERLKTLLG